MISRALKITLKIALKIALPLLLALLRTSTAQQLVKIGQCKTGTSICQAVFLQGNYAYATDRSSSLAMVNISNPENPWVEGSIGRPWISPLSSFVLDTIAYDVGDGINLECISVASPSSPRFLGYLTLPRGSYLDYDGIYVKGNIAYFCGGDANRLYLVNVSNPHVPALLDSFVTTGWSIDLDMKDSLLFITGFNPNPYYDFLTILNINNPHQIGEIGSCSVFPWIMDVVVSGNYAYTANWATGDTNTGVMNVVDVSNPRSPTVIAHPDSLVGAANAVYWDSNYVYVATRNYLYSDTTDTVVGGVRVVDVHNPLQPRVVAGYDLHYPHDGLDVKAKFPYVYVAGRDSFFVFQFFPSGVNREEASNPASPETFLLYQNTPNPFRDATETTYWLPSQSEVRLVIYNAEGQIVKESYRGKQKAGQHVSKWDGRSDQGRKVGPGVYFYRIKAGSWTRTRKMVVVR